MSSPRSVLIPCAVAALMVTVPARGAEDADLGKLVTEGLAAMDAEKWDQALPLMMKAADTYDKDAAKLYGAQFGVVWYRRGICELQMRRWQDAMRSFERCYQGYPNTPEDRGNLYYKKALLKWGDAAVGAGDWDLATRMYQKFLEERDKVADSFPQGMFHINLAVSHLKLGHLPEGGENLEIALRNKNVFPTPDAALVTGFQELVAASIKEKSEQVLIDFLTKNRADLTFAPADAAAYERSYLKLAADVTAAGFTRAAFAIYQLVPDTAVAVDDLKAAIAALSSRPGVVDDGRLVDRARMQADLARLEEERRGGQPVEAVRLAGIALLHEKAGNLRGACAAYEQLERYYERSANREENLFNLVRTASLIGEGMKADTYGRKFIAAFPRSTHAPEIRKTLLSTLFAEGRYERCIELAEPLLGTVEAGGAEHDLCLHVLGGSLYYTGQHAKARPLLDDHVAKYPRSRFALEALFMQASNRARLQDWPKAAELLDGVLAKCDQAPGNPFTSYALYDRACCHAALQESAPALNLVARLEKEFPEADNLDEVMNLKGALLLAANDFSGAGAAYKKAGELAGSREHAAVEEESKAGLARLREMQAKKKSEGEGRPKR
ncbi:tetratricopeptide repeat protein [Luteolibacter ambystomatis]|uniref:Tetratricopeptide repeat protein n=1 Tax=Luteolibacter ambystomatis TaxID=2824561 RepID=A0A975G7V2_9BACT|nr:tetratricopeptide repeat protein [Luteolibacter ambystomatis]QUE50694.1 tetratricopeptide repeat protein [Luteolibacter ambystomatis]